MKERKHFTRKHLVIFSICMICLLSVLWGSLYYTHPSRMFHRATGQLFYEEMTASTLNMHYTLADPGAYGIKEYQAILPCYNSQEHEESIAALEDMIDFYNGLDTSRLSDQDTLTLTLLLSYLRTTLEKNRFPYHEEPLSPGSGMQSQLPILLAEYTFRGRRDVEDYLSLLSQTEAYFASLLTFEKEKKEAGLLMSAASLRDVAEQCRTILTEEALHKKEHFLQITFQERLQTLCSQQLLTSQEANDYIEKNNLILREVMLPAYQSLAKGLTGLADPAILAEGLAARPNGAAYYEALLRSETGSFRNIEEISQLLSDTLESEFQQLCSLLQTIEPYYLTQEASQQCNDLFPLESCGQMLTDLRERMNLLFPEFPGTNDIPPAIHVKEVAPCLQDYCAPAFYLTPPLDDTVHNSIYINTKTTIAPIDLYTTLAHEGFPGHLYQTVYANRLLTQQDRDPIEQLLWFGGYLEGWALYVEFMAYDYASSIMQEAGYPEYASLVQVEKHNRSTQLCLYSLLDVLIHHENTGYQGTAELLAEFGITNSASVNAIYEYIVEEPANYPKYYLGYLEILMLKNTCQETWGSNYSDYQFHKFFLENGPADFQTLQKLALSPEMLD